VRKIVLREWEPELTTEYEFRAFIYQNKLTAISQYDHYTAYPTLEKEKVDIKLAIVSAWKELHTSVGEVLCSLTFFSLFLRSN